jgi:hypothetical protein
VELLRTGLALESAEDQLELLRRMRPGFRDYIGQLPFVLERLENVWRSIQDIKGKSPAFAAWWASLNSDSARVALRQARISELKFDRRVTTESLYMSAGEGGIRFGPITANGTDAEGVEHTVGIRHIGSAGEAVEVALTFTVGAWAGCEVLPTLENMLQRLKHDIVPTAQEFARQQPARQPS